MFYGLLFVLRQLQGCYDAGVALNEFCYCEAQGYLRALCVIFYKVHYGVQAAVYGSAVVLRRAEVLPCWPLLVFGYVQTVPYEFVNTLVLDG